MCTPSLVYRMVTWCQAVKIGASGYGEVRYYSCSYIYVHVVDLQFITDAECVQTLVHPTLSVWTVSTMPNGDIVSGSGDGVIRIFSASEERWASSEDLAAYDQQVASQSLNT